MMDFLKEHVLLTALTLAFAGLALDIAYPAVVLSIMGLSRWLVSRRPDMPTLEGEAA